MNFRLYIVIASFLLANVALAQKNFEKGYVIKISKDTVRGYIDNQEWVRSPKTILFKTSLNDVEQSLKQSDIVGFGIERSNEQYALRSFTIETLSRGFGKTMFVSIPKYAVRNKVMSSKTAFLRVISGGQVKLYFFMDDDQEEHFLAEQDGELTALVFHVASIDGQVTELKEYQRQLKNILTNECKNFSASQIEQTDYKLSSLQKLFNRYNACFGGQSGPNEQVSAVAKVQIGIMAGASLTKFSYNFLPTLEEKWGITPSVGIFLNYIIPRARGKFGIANEVHTYSYKTGSTTNSSVSDKYSINFMYLGIKNMLRYVVYSGSNEVYLLVGVSNGFQIKSEATRTINYSSGTQTTDAIEKDNIRKHEQGLIAGVGLSIQRISIETRYTMGNGFAALVGSKSTTGEISLMAKYRLTSK